VPDGRPRLAEVSINHATIGFWATRPRCRAQPSRAASGPRGPEPKLTAGCSRNLFLRQLTVSDVKILPLVDVLVPRACIRGDEFPRSRATS
jgi:hypothetical protein